MQSCKKSLPVRSASTVNRTVWLLSAFNDTGSFPIRNQMLHAVSAAAPDYWSFKNKNRWFEAIFENYVRGAGVDDTKSM